MAVDTFDRMFDELPDAVKSDWSPDALAEWVEAGAEPSDEAPASRDLSVDWFADAPDPFAGDPDAPDYPSVPEPHADRCRCGECVRARRAAYAVALNEWAPLPGALRELATRAADLVRDRRRFGEDATTTINATVAYHVALGDAARLGATAEQVAAAIEAAHDATAGNELARVTELAAALASTDHDEAPNFDELAAAIDAAVAAGATRRSAFAAAGYPELGA